MAATPETGLKQNLAFIQRGMDVLDSPPGDFEIDKNDEDVCMLWGARYLAEGVVSILETVIENGVPTDWALDDFLALGGSPGSLKNGITADLKLRTADYILNAKAIGEQLVLSS